MPRVIFILNGSEIPVPHVTSTIDPIEKATDVVTLDGHLYTDFTALRQGVTTTYSVLHEDEYNVLYEIYKDQFRNPYASPILTVDHYGIVDQRVRMYINEREIVLDGCQVRNVQISYLLRTPIIKTQPDSLPLPPETS